MKIRLNLEVGFGLNVMRSSGQGDWDGVPALHTCPFLYFIARCSGCGEFEERENQCLHLARH